MSCVTLIASDKPLPLCSCREPRTKIVQTGAAKYTVSLPCGFQVSEHCYYRQAVDELDLPIRLFQYELSLTPEESDLRNLQDYLRAGGYFLPSPALRHAGRTQCRCTEAVFG